ncbi:MAG TPA: hypothetical protein VK928_12045, partial [Longimicrobiales bacterium]|nr:hypothetical protein [Longimicrobiales bacterium]
MMPRAWGPACAAACATLVASAAAQAQSASVWIDANAAHSRPPASTALDAASYGLLGARLRVDGAGSGLELSAAAGRGGDADAGSWLSGRGMYGVSRVFGSFDVALGVTGSAMTFLSPVRLDGDNEYSQSLFSGGVRPSAGFSVAGTRIGAEATYTRGAWRSEVTHTVVPINRPSPL